ncbi:MAG: YigZ family protein [Cyclobacteriaceae bacterium]
MKNQFTTITAPSEGFLKEKGSKFLSFAIPVDSEDSVKDVLDNLRKTYYDARHYCYAYVIGLKKQSFRANDDGEPNHSAGDPILGQIRSKELTNTLVVVVRYFGGTKLGVGGLISAYKIAAEDALNNATFKTIYAKKEVKIDFGYDSTSEVERVLGDIDITYLDKTYTDRCVFTMMLKDEDCPILLKKTELMADVKIEIRED